MGSALSTHAFSEEAISDETRACNAQIEALLKAQVPNYMRMPQEIRDDREGDKGLFPAARPLP